MNGEHGASIINQLSAFQLNPSTQANMLLRQQSHLLHVSGPLHVSIADLSGMGF